MAYFHRHIFTPMFSLYNKNICSIHTGTDTSTFKDILLIFHQFFLASDKMRLSLFKLLQPSRSHSLVDGFDVAGAQIFRAARGW